MLRPIFCVFDLSEVIVVKKNLQRCCKSVFYFIYQVTSFFNKNSRLEPAQAKSESNSYQYVHTSDSIFNVKGDENIINCRQNRKILVYDSRRRRYKCVDLKLELPKFKHIHTNALQFYFLINVIFNPNYHFIIYIQKFFIYINYKMVSIVNSNI